MCVLGVAVVWKVNTLAQRLGGLQFEFCSWPSNFFELTIFLEILCDCATSSLRNSQNSTLLLINGLDFEEHLGRECR